MSFWTFFSNITQGASFGIECNDPVPSACDPRPSSNCNTILQVITNTCGVIVDNVTSALMNPAEIANFACSMSGAQCMETATLYNNGTNMTPALICAQDAIESAQGACIEEQDMQRLIAALVILGMAGVTLITTYTACKFFGGNDSSAGDMVQLLTDDETPEPNNDEMQATPEPQQATLPWDAAPATSVEIEMRGYAASAA